MRIFVLGAGGTGSLLAQLLLRQGHTVWCGDRDLDRALRFLGKKSPIPLQEANARNLRSIVRAGRGCQLLINASPARFNETVLRAALRLRAHYLDLAAHLMRNPFKPEHFRYAKRFEQKRRMALMTAGAAPGLTNLLISRTAEMLDEIESVHLRLYESTESADPISTWSAEVSFDAAVSRPRVYRERRFRLAKRFSERELFRFPPPIGEVPVYLAAQDEVCIVPHFLRMQEMDAKIGGNDIERLRRWYRQGKLHRSKGLVAKRFPRTPTPLEVARLIRRGVLENARFAAALLVRGRKKEQPLLVRWDANFPTLYQIRARGLLTTPIAFAAAQIAAVFVKHFPRDLAGVYSPGKLPAAVRRAVLAEARLRGVRVAMKITKRQKPKWEEEEF